MSIRPEPLLPEEELTLSAYNQVGSQWASEHDRPGYWKTEMELFHQLLPHGHILEIGSGGGRDAKELVKLGYQYTGTDISIGLLQVARLALPDCQFFEQSVYALNLDRLFDGFWASAVLLHIPRQRIHEALSSIHLTQKHGAIGFISLKDGEGEELEEDVIDGHAINRHFTYWTRQQFESVLSATGFEVVDYIYHPQSLKTKWHCFFVQAI